MAGVIIPIHNWRRHWCRWPCHRWCPRRHDPQVAGNGTKRARNKAIGPPRPRHTTLLLFLAIIPHSKNQREQDSKYPEHQNRWFFDIALNHNPRLFLFSLLSQNQETINQPQFISSGYKCLHPLLLSPQTKAFNPNSETPKRHTTNTNKWKQKTLWFLVTFALPILYLKKQWKHWKCFEKTKFQGFVFNTHKPKTKAEYKKITALWFFSRINNSNLRS